MHMARQLSGRIGICHNDTSLELLEIVMNILPWINKKIDELLSNNA